MESCFGSQNDENSGVNEKLDKLAEDIKNLPEERTERLRKLMEKDSYTIKEVVKVLGVNYHTVRRAVANGSLKSFRLGEKIVRIPKSELKKYVKGERAYSVAETAKMLEVSALTIRRYIDSGKIKAFRFTKRGPWLIDEAEVQRIMQTGEE